LKEPVITVRLSITANLWCWGPEVLSQPAFSAILWVAEPLGEPEALIEKESG
jgi:hypothetical protein